MAEGAGVLDHDFVRGDEASGAALAGVANGVPQVRRRGLKRGDMCGARAGLHEVGALVLREPSAAGR